MQSFWTLAESLILPWLLRSSPPSPAFRSPREEGSARPRLEFFGSDGAFDFAADTFEEFDRSGGHELVMEDLVNSVDNGLIGRDHTEAVAELEVGFRKRDFGEKPIDLIGFLVDAGVMKENHSAGADEFAPDVKVFFDIFKPVPTIDVKDVDFFVPNLGDVGEVAPNEREVFDSELVATLHHIVMSVAMSCFGIAFEAIYTIDLTDAGSGKREAGEPVVDAKFNDNFWLKFMYEPLGKVFMSSPGGNYQRRTHCRSFYPLRRI